MKYVDIHMDDGREQNLHVDSVEPVLDCGYFILRCNGHEMYVRESNIEAIDIRDEHTLSTIWINARVTNKDK